MKIADMHCDTIYEIYERRARGEECGFLSNSMHIDLEKMKKGDYLLQNFALFVPKEDVEGKMPLPEYALRLADVFFSELRKAPDAIGIVKSYADIEENRKQGRMSAMLSMEEGAACEGKLEYLRIFYELGVRMFTFTWNYPNELAWPNGTEGPDKGLTEAGRAVVEEMGRLHMIVDTSHLNDAGTREVLMEAKRPPVASHSDARAVTAHSRNLPDDLLALFGEKGGLIGLNFSNHFLGSPAVTSFPGRDDIDFSKGLVQVSLLRDIVRHGMYIMDKAGEDVLCLGTDFDGIEPALELRDASEMPRLAEAFLEAGATETQVEKIFSGNALRYLKEML